MTSAPLTKDYLIQQWSGAIAADTFLVPKHDPYELMTTWERFRTVLTPELVQNLSGFICSGQFTINVHGDTRFPNTSGLYEIVPQGTPPFSVAGSGVPGWSITPTGDYDRLVVAYGKVTNTGWHGYAEDSAHIASGLAAGRLTLRYQL